MTVSYTYEANETEEGHSLLKKTKPKYKSRGKTECVPTYNGMVRIGCKFRQNHARNTDHAHIKDLTKSFV